VSAEEPRYYRILFNWSDFGAAPKAPLPGLQNVLFTIDPDTLPYTDVMMQLSLGDSHPPAVADFIVMAVSASLRQDRPGHEDGGFLFRVAVNATLCLQPDDGVPRHGERPPRGTLAPALSVQPRLR
jgi:hypothetical protein